MRLYPESRQKPPIPEHQAYQIIGILCACLFWLLVSMISVLTSGCGSTGYNALSEAPTAPITGAQPIVLIRVGYQDTPAPAYDDSAMVTLVDLMDQTVRRSSSNIAWITSSYANVTLPQNQAYYDLDHYRDLVGQPPSGNLESDCFNSYQVLNGATRIYLTPVSPEIYLGFATNRTGFCSARQNFNILGTPTVHEWGHAAGGFLHDTNPGTIMYPGSDVDWSRNFSQQSKNQAGWK